MYKSWSRWGLEFYYLFFGWTYIAFSSSYFFVVPPQSYGHLRTLWFSYYKSSTMQPCYSAPLHAFQKSKYFVPLLKFGNCIDHEVNCQKPNLVWFLFSKAAWEHAFSAGNTITRTAYSSTRSETEFQQSTENSCMYTSATAVFLVSSNVWDT